MRGEDAPQLAAQLDAGPWVEAQQRRDERRAARRAEREQRQASHAARAAAIASERDERIEQAATLVRDVQAEAMRRGHRELAEAPDGQQ